MQIERTKVLGLLKDVEPAVAKNTLIPVLNHFWFTGKRLVTYNDHIGISVGCATEFTGAVPLTVMQLLESSKAEKIEFLPTDDGVLNIKAASSKWKLAMMPPTDFIFKMPKATTDEPMAVDAGRFMQAMGSCMKSIGNDTSNPDLMGVTLINDTKAKRILMFSTDRATISHGSVKYTGDLGFERVILKTEFCQQLLRIAKGATELYLEIGESHALLRNDGLTLFGRLERLDNPLDFVAQVAELLTSGTKQKSVVWPAKFRDMLDRACIITDGAIDKTKTKVSVKDREVLFTTVSERGEAFDKTTFEAAHPDVVAHIDPRRVMDGLDDYNRLTITKECVVMINDAKEKDDLVYLVSATGK